MKLAEQYGFIVQTYGGTAILATHKNQLDHYGEEKYKSIQKMNGKCLKELGYPECETGCQRCYLNKQRGCQN